METRNTQKKMENESPVYVDEVNLLDPIEDETARLREELETERDKYLRLAAEYENYRRRTKKEQATAAEKGKRELLMRIVSLADDFDLGIANLKNTSDSAVIEGLELIANRLKALLEANKVVPFDSAGEVFNPEFHEAFDVISADESNSGKVHSELRRGYFWNGELLRPALVIVAQ